MEAGRKEAGQDELKQLQSEVDELRGLLAKLDMERETLMKQARILEDRQVTNWKWIQDATKFSGVSVNKCSPKSCTFHFHPMWKSVSQQTYSMTVEFTKKGYKVGQCFLPESIHSPDLDNAKPLKQLVWDISNLVDSFVNRQQQIKELEEELGENTDHFVFYSNDTLRTNLRIRVSYQATRNFVITIHLDYRPNEILPYEVALEVENGKGISDTEIQDFETNCNPFYRRPLVEAFRQAF